jgi:hypothetical protein
MTAVPGQEQAAAPMAVKQACGGLAEEVMVRPKSHTTTISHATSHRGARPERVFRTHHDGQEEEEGASPCRGCVWGHPGGGQEEEK